MNSKINKKSTVKRKPVKVDKLEHITSLFDFNKKIKEDRRYGDVLILMYRTEMYDLNVNVTKARKWFNSYVSNIRITQCSCAGIIKYVNFFITKFNGQLV